MTLFGKDLVRSLVLGFAFGSAAMVLTFGAVPVQAASIAAPTTAASTR